MGGSPVSEGGIAMTEPDDREQRRDLVWCEGCGDRVERLGATGFCALCEEIDARLEAHIASVAADLTERIADLLLCYLHPADVHEIVDRVAPEYEPAEPRLREVYEHSHRFVEGRERRASGFRAGDEPM
jgi:hypothetical protein